MVHPGEVSGAAPRGARSDSPPDSPWAGRAPDAATEAYWSRVQALRAALDDLRPVG